jgi:hypothetical protein
MSESDIYWTFVTASKYAGSFYQAMGNAGLAADPNNKRRILLHSLRWSPPTALLAGCIKPCAQG